MIESLFIVVGLIIGVVSFLIYSHVYSSPTKTVWHTFDKELPPNNVMIRVMADHLDFNDSEIDYKVAECWIMVDDVLYYVEGINPNGKICKRKVLIERFKNIRWAMWK